MPIIRVGFRNGTVQSWEIDDRVPVERDFRAMLLQSVGLPKNVDFGIRSESGEDVADYGWVTIHMAEVDWTAVDEVTDMTQIDPGFYERDN